MWGKTRYREIPIIRYISPNREVPSNFGGDINCWLVPPLSMLGQCQVTMTGGSTYPVVCADHTPCTSFFVEICSFCSD